MFLLPSDKKAPSKQDRTPISPGSRSMLLPAVRTMQQLEDGSGYKLPMERELRRKVITMSGRSAQSGVLLQSGLKYAERG